MDLATYETYDLHWIYMMTVWIKFLKGLKLRQQLHESSHAIHVGKALHFKKNQPKDPKEAMEQIDNRLTTDSKAECLLTLKIAWPAGRKLQEHVDIEQTVALLLWHWEHHRTWTTNPGVQTRPESVWFPKHQKHSRTSRTIGIQQPNYTLTFDTPWHTFSCFMLFPTGLHLRSRRGPSSFKAKIFSASLRQFCRYKMLQTMKKTRHVQTSAQTCTNMNKLNHVIIFVVILLQSPLGTASANCGGSCKCKASVPKCRRKERMRWETDQLRIPFVLFISLHVLSFCSHSCFDWDETFCFTRSSMISWCDVQSQIRYTF